MQRVIITGALGNLGSKLLEHLLNVQQISEIVGLDLHPPTSEQLEAWSRHPKFAKVRFVLSDLTQPQDARWRTELRRGDAVVHFAAKNPFPEASWEDANTSLDMTLNLALAASQVGVRRFIFASSNHVMGRYKDRPLADLIGPGELTTALEHGVGTVWNTGNRHMDSTAYAVAKSSGERICRAFGNAAGSQTKFVCVRIGWCQPGENLPATLSAAGTPTQSAQRSEDLNALATNEWFRNMWLSNRDFAQLFEKAILADHSPWQEGCIIVNGMSANTGMKWSLEDARRLLDYHPVDNVNN